MRDCLLYIHLLTSYKSHELLASSFNSKNRTDIDCHDIQDCGHLSMLDCLSIEHIASELEQPSWFRKTATVDGHAGVCMIVCNRTVHLSRDRKGNLAD